MDDAGEEVCGRRRKATGAATWMAAPARNRIGGAVEKRRVAAQIRRKLPAGGGAAAGASAAKGGGRRRRTGPGVRIWSSRARAGEATRQGQVAAPEWRREAAVTTWRLAIG